MAKNLNYLINLSRITILLAIIVLISNKFYFQKDILAYIALLLAFVSIISIGVFIYYLRKGIKSGEISRSTKIVLEADTENAVKNGILTEEQAKDIPDTIVIESKYLFLNLVFNLAINYHFDPLPVEVLHDALPHVPPMQLKGLYSKSQDVHDELNDYFRSQKFANKADVITKSGEIKKYLVKTYPWMMADTLENTYNYFFLGIGNR
ncbi:MAG: hypothetical protein Q4P14_00755 [Methanobacteriaceae archaeon]|nr:hypothetical protein [Methanobacteriaceae archaeon]